MRLLYYLLSVKIYLVSVFAYAQSQEIIRIKTPTVCYAGHEHSNLYIPPPEKFLEWKANRHLRQEDGNAVFSIDFIGFENSPAAREAFQYAADIWSQIIKSDIPIRVQANWRGLNQGVLGGAAPWAAVRNFDGAQKLGVFYPIALAEKMVGGQINNPTDYEIFAQFNSDANWHFDPTTEPPAGSFDFITVVLHELGHGLGFFHTFSLVQGNTDLIEYGFATTDIPVTYDTELMNADGEILLKTFPSPSGILKFNVTNENLFYNSTSAKNANDEFPKLYAPATYAQGSSIAHLDEVKYNNTDNALMTPQIGQGERIFNPGDVVQNIFFDMGYQFIRIEHRPLKNSEDLSAAYQVKILLKPDKYENYTYETDELYVYYRINNGDLNEVELLPTSNPDEFVADIQGSGEEALYSYFIRIKDNKGRVFNKPGKIFNTDEDDTQVFFQFTTGPDTTAPEIFHQPAPFLTLEEESYQISALVLDDLGVASVKLELKINEEEIETFLLSEESSNPDLFIKTIVFEDYNLENGDKISYRFIATDASSNQNTTQLPEEGFFEVNIVGLLPVQDNYANDFNSPSDDFFGNNYRVEQPDGFTSPAIHSDHPYLDGTGPNFESNYIYQLRVPIRIASENTLFQFDEIVLVEPGATGSTFGSSQFWDYVIVEGSKDGGITWEPLLNGYDSRADNAWLTRYNSSFDGDNSTAVGDPSLYRTRNIDLLSKYEPGDVVVFRFRLFADQLAHGWGWAIDNLKIQIDQTPPTIRHDHLDYILPGPSTQISFIVEEDPSGIKEIEVEFKINNGELQLFSFLPFQEETQYNFQISKPGGFQGDDVLEYRIKATDGANNLQIFPSSGFIVAPVLTLTSAQSTYVNDFNAASNDFIGNFFSVTTPPAFQNGAIHSVHPYPEGRGLNKTTTLSYILKQPITVNANNPFIVFDEIAIVEPGLDNSVFPSAGFKDYVVVEVSKDAGLSWQALTDGWDSRVQNNWRSAFNQGGGGLPSMYRTRYIHMLNEGNLNNGEQVLLRFKLFSDELNNGWGWAIDNLQIQGPITSVESPQFAERAIQLYPNPTKDKVQLRLEIPGYQGQVQLSMMDMMGRPNKRLTLEVNQGVAEASIDTQNLPAGNYLIRIQTEKMNLSKKLMVVK